MIKKLGLGTVQFGMEYGISNQGGITQPDEVKMILKYAAQSGIDLLDTAYGYGTSEQVLGKIGTKGFKIVSKFLPATSNTSIPTQVQLSLQRLKTDKLYGLLAHRPLDLLKHPQTWDYLQGLKIKSIVKKVGFSFNSVSEIDLILNRGFIPDLVQVPFNYFDSRFKPYMIELIKQGCEIHTRSAFLQGLFFIRPDKLNPFFDEIKPTLVSLQKLTNLQGRLLNYCLKQTFIDKVIVGVNTLEQLKQNIASLEKKDDLPLLFDQEINNNILSPSEWPKTK